jgi:hypothetical protein
MATRLSEYHLMFAVEQAIVADAQWPDSSISPSISSSSPWQITYADDVDSHSAFREMQGKGKGRGKINEEGNEKFFHFLVQYKPEAPDQGWNVPLKFAVPRWYSPLLVDIMFPAVTMMGVSGMPQTMTVEEGNQGTNNRKKKAGTCSHKRIQTEGGTTVASLSSETLKEWQYTALVFRNLINEIRSISNMAEDTQLISLHCYAAREVLGIKPIRHDDAGRQAYEHVMHEGFKVQPYAVNSALWCR